MYMLESDCILNGNNLNCYKIQFIKTLIVSNCCVRVVHIDFLNFNINLILLNSITAI